MKHTKIVATVSDKRCEPEFIRQLAEAGVNVIRMNTAHLNAEGIAKITNNAREADPRLALMIDTKGPEIRTTPTHDGGILTFAAGDIVEIKGNPDGPTTRSRICLNYPGIANYIKAGDRLLIDDGEIAFRVSNVEEGSVSAIAENAGNLGSRKSVNIPGVKIPLPSVTLRDRASIEAAAKLGIDFVAHSFVRSKADVAAVQEILDSLGSPMKIISKIENQEGVDNFDEIMKASYGIMIARGDLGIEVALEMLPGIQQNMINKCVANHKPVIVATQMLHSMIEHPRPTRAEVSDIANAVYQRADAMMLSGETASGKYPVEAVKVMARVACEVERELNVNIDVPPMEDVEVASFLARQAVFAERAVGIKAIFTDAYHGATARYIASYRANVPVFAVCYNSNIFHWLALSYGVRPYLIHEKHTNQPVIPGVVLSKLKESGKLEGSPLVAYVSGSDRAANSLKIDTLTNLMG